MAPTRPPRPAGELLTNGAVRRAVARARNPRGDAAQAPPAAPRTPWLAIAAVAVAVVVAGAAVLLASRSDATIEVEGAALAGATSGAGGSAGPSARPR